MHARAEQTQLAGAESLLLLQVYFLYESRVMHARPGESQLAEGASLLPLQMYLLHQSWLPPTPAFVFLVGRPCIYALSLPRALLPGVSCANHARTDRKYAACCGSYCGGMFKNLKSSRVRCAQQKYCLHLSAHSGYFHCCRYISIVISSARRSPISYLATHRII
jgi:hypothetical protein